MSYVVEEGLQDIFNISTLDHREPFIVTKNFFLTTLELNYIYKCVFSPLFSSIARKTAKACTILPKSSNIFIKQYPSQ